MEADILFKTKRKGAEYGNVFYNRRDKAPIIISNGQYRTSNKEEIADLLHSDLMGRGLLSLVTPTDIVEKWLTGEVPDSLNEEVLNKVSEDGLRELAKIFNLSRRRHGGHGTIIKTMLKGKPISNAVIFVLEKYSTDEGVTDWLKLAMDAGIIYRNAPWYKYRVGDEEDISKDLSIGRAEVEAQAWALDRKDEIEKRIGQNVE